jgi:hypothetical protein
VVEKKKALVLYIWTLELLRVAVRHHSNFCTGTDRVLKLPGRSLEGAHIIITADICLTERWIVYLMVAPRSLKACLPPYSIIISDTVTEPCTVTGYEKQTSPT